MWDIRPHSDISSLANRICSTFCTYLLMCQIGIIKYMEMKFIFVFEPLLNRLQLSFPPAMHSFAFSTIPDDSVLLFLQPSGYLRFQLLFSCSLHQESISLCQEKEKELHSKSSFYQAYKRQLFQSSLGPSRLFPLDWFKGHSNW